MASSRLRREIESLLYKRWRIGLDPADPRGPVLGMRTSAEPKTDRIDPVLLRYLMDHGWLTWAASHYVVYADDALAAYWAADNPVNACGEATEPTLGASNEYDSLLGDGGRTAPEKNSWEYSGLTRLFIQSIQAAGRNWSEDFAPYLPANWGASGDTLGCIRSSTGIYWLLHISQTDGVEAAELQPADDCVCLAALANGGTLTSTDQKIADAIVLGYSTLVMVDPEAAEPEARLVEVVDPVATQWTDVYADSHAPLIWGWSWRYQSRGASDEDTCGAIVCTHKFTSVSTLKWNLHYRESVLAVTFDGNSDPVGTVSESRAGYFQTLGTIGPSICTISDNTIIAKFANSYIVEPVGTTPSLGVVTSCYLPSGSVGGAEVRNRQSSVSNTTTTTCTGTNGVATQTFSGTSGTIYPQTFVNGYSRGPGYVGESGSGSSSAAANLSREGYDFARSYEKETVFTVYTEKIYFDTAVHGVAWNYGQEGFTGQHSSLNVSAFIYPSFGYTCESLLYVMAYGCALSPIECDPTITLYYAAANVKTIVNENEWDNGTGTAAYTAFSTIATQTIFNGLDYVSTSTASADSRASWDDRGQVTGMPLPDGLSPTGAAITGVWAGIA